mgnify:CR=1 FL=1
MRLLIDENVPDSVAQFFSDRGHEIVFARDLLPRGTPDQVIAALGNELDSIIVSWDQDLLGLVSRAPVGTRRTLRSLGRITYRCRYPNGRRRTEELIDWIEFEFAQVQRRRDRRMLVQVGDSYFRIER